MFGHVRIWRLVRRLRIQPQEPALRKLHALQKSQKRTFSAAAPVSFRAKRALSAFQFGFSI
ncbi:hypothetical protein PRIP_07163 [Listeria riparia FSL S10-1204]|uniref:Uncharacterized protein n=1 Tax=Listeria riparia FSL S10-1204 TaxID=1265816 RepID=W7D966_9LIST|nr:hypothetical protein PRIP_07163 [Listeria riparia FSL S10-1204]